jgi:hypothetical protein
MGILLAIRKFIFGYDIFISYSRKDSLDYAYSIARHFMKKEYGYECYIDQLSSTTPGKELPGNIVTALQKSTAFVIIGSAGAMHSQPIAEEIRSFKRTKSNNPIIPIDIDGKIFEADWYPEIEGLAIIDELESSFYNKQASTDILERIHNSLNFTKKSTKLRRTAVSLAAVFGVLVLATFWIFRQLGQAQVELTRTLAQNRYQEMTGLISRSRINSDSNSIIALKYALKAFEDYKDIDTAGIAERNLLDLFNNYPVTIKNAFSTGGYLTPGGRYIVQGEIRDVATRRRILPTESGILKFSSDDQFAISENNNSLSVFSVADGRLVSRMKASGDSSIYADFSHGGDYLIATISRYGAENEKVKVLEAKTFRLVADILLKSEFQVADFFADQNGGHFLLIDNEKVPYLYHTRKGMPEQLYKGRAVPKYQRSDYVYTGDRLILEQSVSASSATGINGRGTVYKFGVRLLDLDGNVQADSTYTYTDHFNGFTNPDQISNYYSFSGNWISFGLYGGLFSQHYLLNTGVRPFPIARRLRFGYGMPENYKLIKLLSEKYLLAVSITNDEYNIHVFRLDEPNPVLVLTVLNKNHPNGNPMDDQFMKSIGISYSASSHFLTVYDRGLGNCTMYYLDKQKITSGQDFVDRVSEKKIFGDLWENISIEK